MQLSDTMSSLLRRWYFVLGGLVLTGILGWTAYQTVPERYEAQGSILMMPADSVVGTDGNPYLYLSGMNDALDVLVRRTNSGAMSEQILTGSTGATYTADRDATTQSPILVFSVEAGSAPEALRLLEAAMTAAEWNLDTMQEELSISEERRITARDLVVDEEATKNTKTPLQMSIIVVGAGLMGTLMATGLLDGLLVRRRMRAKERQESTSPEPPEQPSMSADAPDTADAAQGHWDAAMWTAPGAGRNGPAAASAHPESQPDRQTVLEPQRR